MAPCCTPTLTPLSYLYEEANSVFCCLCCYRGAEDCRTEEDVGGGWKKERTSDRPGDGRISDWLLLNDETEQAGKNGRQTPSSPSCCWTGKWSFIIPRWLAYVGVLPRLLLVDVCFVDVCLCTLYCLRWLRRLQLVDNFACTAVPGDGGNCIYSCGFKGNHILQR